MAAQTYQLSPATPIGVAIGTDISPIHPAAIAAVRLGAEVAGGIDGTATASGKDHAGRRRTWSLGLDQGIGHPMLFEVDSAARAPVPPHPISPQTSSGASDRKSAPLP